MRFLKLKVDNFYFGIEQKWIKAGRFFLIISDENMMYFGEILCVMW
jgi:hypothetical protein